MNINGIRLSSSYCVTWLGITDPQTKLRLNIRHDFQAHILKGSHAIRVEHQMFLQFFTNASRPASFISSSKVSFDFFHCATRRIPIVRSRMKCQKRAPSRRHDRSQQVSCCRIVTFLQSSPCLQRVLPQFGDSVVRLTLVRAMSAVSICCKNSRSMAVLMISVDCSAVHSNIISDSLTTPDKERLRILRPLLKILLFAREFLRTTKASQVDETRSILLSLSCREIVDGSYCISKSRLISYSSCQRKNPLAEVE